MRKSKYGRCLAGLLIAACVILLTGAFNAGASGAAPANSNSRPYDWTQRKYAGSFSWSAVASSSDGTKLVAACYVVAGSQFSGGYLYTSADSGNTWAKRTSAGAKFWSSVASSSDGKKLAAAAYGDYIYTSTDSGAAWTPRKSAGKGGWIALASSSDGTKLVAAAVPGFIYTSTDSGATWTNRTTNLGSRDWQSVASSSDGAKLIAAEATNASGTGGYIYSSKDSGKTWVRGMGPDFWQSVSCSSDGTKLAAVEDEGYIYVSTDSGATWTEQTGAGDNYWSAVAFSSDGTTLVAAANGIYTDSTVDTGSGGFIYTSTDAGYTWTKQIGAGQRGWSTVASSSDGTKLIAAVGETWLSVNWSGYIYTGASAPAYTISGTVKDGNRSPLKGATMALAGTSSATTKTASDGTYSFSGLSNGKYSVTPSMAGYTFNPQKAPVTIKNKNVTGVNFSASALYSISGKVTAGNKSLSGVTVTLSGPAERSTKTKSDGSYSFTGLTKGSYTVTPSPTGYTFKPLNRKISLNQNVTGQDFAGTKK